MVVQLWYYVLAIPAASVAAADALAPAFNNPDGIEATFQRYPRSTDAEGSTTYPNPAEYWVATFLAFDLSADGAPSREALESTLNSGDAALGNILYWRMDNPWKPGSSGPILRAKHTTASGTLGMGWSMAQAVASLGY